MQVRRCQHDRGKSIFPARLHADSDAIPELAVEGGYLGLGSGNKDICLPVRLANLPVNPLDHGFQLAVLPLEYFDKLLGADVVGQGPQTFAAPA